MNTKIKYECMNTKIQWTYKDQPPILKYTVVGLPIHSLAIADGKNLECIHVIKSIEKKLNPWNTNTLAG
jgi:hypothetical protein